MLRRPTNKRTTWALSLTRLSTKIILLSFSSTLTSRKSWRPCPRGDPPCWPPEITVGTNMMASMSMRMNILSRVTRPKELWKERGLSNISRAQQEHYEFFWWAITRLPKYGEISKSVCARRIEYRCMKNIWNCNQSIKYHLCRLGQKWWQKHEKHEKCPPVAESCTHNSFALQNKPHHPPLLILLLLLFHKQGSSLPTNLLLSHPHHPHLLLVYHTQLLFACLPPHVNLWRQLNVWAYLIFVIFFTRAKFLENKVTTRWEGPQSLSYQKYSLSKDGLLCTDSCVIAFVKANRHTWPEQK